MKRFKKRSKSQESAANHRKAQVTGCVKKHSKIFKLYKYF